MTTPTEASLRDSRKRLGILSQLDQFLETPHSLLKRERMAWELKTSTVKLESLISMCHGGHPQTVLLNRVNLTLLMAGVAPKVRRGK